MTKAKIENWSVISYGVAEPWEGEEVVSVLVGLVVGHKKISDGTEIVTSPLRMISYRNSTAKTRNTVYELGQPNPNFLAFLQEKGFSIEQYEFGAWN